MTFKRICSKYLIVLSVIIFSTSSVSGEPIRVLILPFAVHSDKDLSFLQKGIDAMLSSRLAQAGKVLPIKNAASEQAIAAVAGPIDEKAAYELGAQLGAAYVAFGAVTVFGDGISTDARFLDVRNQKPVVEFSQFGKSQGDVLFHINLFAEEVNEKAFGRKTYTYRKSAAPPAPTPEAERRRHPETLIRTDRGRLRGGMGLGESGVWRSRRYKAHLVGVAIGDVDDDGKNETVFISKDRVYVHRYTGDGFARIKEIEGEPTHNYISVDVADINQNGFSEIFVTNHANLEQEQYLSSFVLEWNGKAFKKISSGDRWFYRVLKEEGKEPVLMGQRRGIKQPFSKGVDKMKWQGGKYVPVERMKLPKNTNIYDFTFGDALNNGTHHLVKFDSGSILRLFDPKKDEIWRSKGRYGGSTVYVEYPDETAASIGEYKEMDRVYLPQRILVIDVDQDGKNEVVVIKNEEVSGRHIRRFRYFSGGLVEGLIWDQMGLRRLWMTREFSGPIHDIAIADMDNDQQDELVMSVSSAGSMVVKKQRSYIVMLEIAPTEEPSGG